MEQTTIDPQAFDAAARDGGDAHGVDAAAERRPGVPMAAHPRPAAGAHWQRPERQPGSEHHLHHAGIERATPVVGTAQPLRGASGLIRRRAYRIPEHHARHWALLMLADRVDVLEDRLGGSLGSRLRAAGLERIGGRVERNPLAALGIIIGAAWFLKKAL